MPFQYKAVLQSEWSGLYQKMAAPHLPAFLSPSHLFLQLLSIIYRVRACGRPRSLRRPVGARGDSEVFCLLRLIQITSSLFWSSLCFLAFLCQLFDKAECRTD